MTLAVVAAVITNPDNSFLTIKRRDGPAPETVGMYEFPGGKVEQGESLEDALKREIREELGYNCTVGQVLHGQINTYSNVSALVIFLSCTLGSREGNGEGFEVVWRSIVDDWSKVLPGAYTAAKIALRGTE